MTNSTHWQRVAVWLLQIAPAFLLLAFIPAYGVNGPTWDHLSSAEINRDPVEKHARRESRKGTQPWCAAGRWIYRGRSQLRLSSARLTMSSTFQAASAWRAYHSTLRAGLHGRRLASVSVASLSRPASIRWH